MSEEIVSDEDRVRTLTVLHHRLWLVLDTIERWREVDEYWNDEIDPDTTPGDVEFWSEPARNTDDAEAAQCARWALADVSRFCGYVAEWAAKDLLIADPAIRLYVRTAAEVCRLELLHDLRRVDGSLFHGQANAATYASIVVTARDALRRATRSALPDIRRARAMIALCVTDATHGAGITPVSPLADRSANFVWQRLLTDEGQGLDALVAKAERVQQGISENARIPASRNTIQDRLKTLREHGYALELPKKGGFVRLDPERRLQADDDGSKVGTGTKLE